MNKERKPHISNVEDTHSNDYEARIQEHVFDRDIYFMLIYCASDIGQFME